MKIAIYGNAYQGEFADALRQLFTALGERDGIELEFERSYFEYLSEALHEFAPGKTFREADPAAADLVISIGGDGTFLHAASAVGAAETPIMGLNAGHLGYLSAAPVTAVGKVVADITQGDYLVGPRTMLQVSCPEIEGHPCALNEVAVMRQATDSMIAVDAFIGSEPLATYLGDGLIIATPTGSTAYNLSVGGPILAPSAPSWVITPVAPHSLTMRPLVVSNNTCITLAGYSRSEHYSLAVDGHAYTLPAGTKVEITRAPYVTNVVRLPGRTFIDSLREKLLWGAAGK